MASENIPGSDDAFASWIINFASVATANATLLNLTSGQTTNMTVLSTAFDNARIDSTAAKAASKGATTVKRNLRKANEELFRSVAKVITVNSEITPTLKAELGLNTTPVPVGPVAPATELSVTGYANGDNVLVWKRNGNASSTTFQIEAQFGSSTDWMMVGTSTKVRFTHAGQTPGVQVRYRIVSMRGGQLSSPSNTAYVYGSAPVEVFNLKAA